MSAAFGVDDGPFVTLTFGRAVSIAGFDGSQLSVEHQVNEVVYAASSATLLDPATVKVELFVDAACPAGPDVLLDAAAGNGIVAVDDGGTWAGASELELPYP